MPTAGGVLARLRAVPAGWVAFAVVLAAYLLYLPSSGYERFYFDSDLYWRLGDAFGSDGGFTLYAYPDPLRGYSFPLVLGGLRELADVLGLGPLTIVRVGNATLVAFLGTQLIPRLARRILPTAAVTLPRILLLNALVFVFWRDHLNFPATDFPALALLASALLLALHRNWFALAAAGLLAGLAMNTRPAYMFAALLIVPLAISLGVREGARWKRAAAAGALVLVGTAVALAPQVAINRHTFDTTSPLPAENGSLALLQLSVGLQAQKYETTIDPRAPDPAVYFLDPTTAMALSERGSYRVDGYGSYLGIAFDHPFRLALGYLRRTFNGLDVQYPSPYVRDIQGDRSRVRSALLYLVLFSAAWVLLRAWRGRSLDRVNWPIALLLALPSLSAVPGAVEPRFFLPAHIVVLTTVCFATEDLRALTPRGRRGRVGLTVASIGFVLGCFAVAAETYSNIGVPVEAP